MNNHHGKPTKKELKARKKEGLNIHKGVYYDIPAGDEFLKLKSEVIQHLILHGERFKIKPTTNPSPHRD